MKFIASMWAIPIALCLSGAAFGDEFTTSGDVKGLGFSAARLTRIAPWYQSRFDSFSPSDGLVPGAVVAVAKDGRLAYLQAIGFQDRAKTVLGTYDFGASVSSRDRQGLADGKTGWLGIEAFVAMEQAGLRINRPNPDGPATKAGVRAGDLITELDGAPLKGLSLADVLGKMPGPANTPIKMKIVHKGQDSASDLSVMRAARRGNTVQLQIRVEQAKLVAEATGAWPILEFEKGKATPLVAISSNEFTVDDEDHSRIAFLRSAAGKVSGLILNPGPWQQKAAMIASAPN